MAAQHTEGIILRKHLLRETSYILVILTKDFGKIKGVIKGIRKPCPQFAGNLEIFTKCDVLVYRKHKKPFDLITQCEAVDYFLQIRKDIERLTYANYFIELVDVTIVEGEPCEEVYEILLGALKMLAEGSSPKRSGRIFELKLLNNLGLSPRMDVCVACGVNKITEYFFSAKDGGILCRKCSANSLGSFTITPGTVNFIRKIQSSSIELASRIKVSHCVGVETEKLLGQFSRFHINRPIKSLKFLARLDKLKTSLRERSVCDNLNQGVHPLEGQYV